MSAFGKILLLSLISVVFGLHFSLFRAVNRKNRLKHTGRWVKRYCKSALWVLGVKLNIRGNGVLPVYKFSGSDKTKTAGISSKNNRKYKTDIKSVVYKTQKKPESHKRDIIFPGKSARLTGNACSARENSNISDRLRADTPCSKKTTEVIQKNYLFVCNHGSYLDALILYSVLENPRFITSTALRGTFLGAITRLANCQIVGGRRQRRLREDIKKVQDLLLSGQNVVLFPEGGTGDGTKLLEFKSPFFQSALQAKKKVQPLCLNYISIDGKPLGAKNKDRVFWHGGFPFWKHFIRLCRVRRVEAELVFTPPLPPKETHRRETALRARRQITREFKGASG